MATLCFTRKDNGPTIEEFIQRIKFKYGVFWKAILWLNLTEEADLWWNSLGIKQLDDLSDEEFEKLFMDKWSCARKKNETCQGLCSTGVSLLQVHGLIQKEKIIVSINPSCQQNLINVNLAKKLQVLAKHIENTRDVQVYKDLKLSMDKYVLHDDFYTSNMDNMDVVLGYPRMEVVDTLNINVQKEFLKLWYKRKKISLYDISINKQVESKEHQVCSMR